MASNRKKIQPPPYNDPGWGDSISVSKKAREELAEVANNADPQKQEQLQEYSQKKTAKLKEYANYSKPAKKTSRLINQEIKDNNVKGEVSNQVDQLNHEINKAVSEIENVLERFLHQLWSAVNNMFLAIYNLILKILLVVFIQPLRNAGKLSGEFLNILNDSLSGVNKWIAGSPSNTSTRPRAVNNNYNSVPAPKVANPEPKKDPVNELPKLYPDVFDGIVFGELSRKGIAFLNIKNMLLYEENKKDFTVEEEQDLLDNALKEIHNCAKLAKSLPSPTKGKYVSRTMVDILEKASMSDLKLFLQYVYTHPKPFIERKLRLSEAFATWAHKGAPV